MNTRFGLATLAAGAAALSLATPLAAQERPASQSSAQRPAMSAADLVTMPRLGAPSVSKDGSLAVYSVATTDPESYARSSEFYLHDLADAGAVPLRLDLGGPASSAVFGGDGWLYFLSSRAIIDGGEERSRLWRVRLGPEGAAGAPMLAADLATGIDGFALAPQGNALAVWAEIARDCATFGCEGDGTAHLTGPGDGLLYEGDAGFVRHWDSWETPGTFARVFVFAMQDG
ncbi:MAG: S9 family peptidase, partial [Alphaproteobacteria bacterium]|nr:S9 family peptidase [Alphaproteobacteria bacterium]